LLRTRPRRSAHRAAGRLSPLHPSSRPGLSPGPSSRRGSCHLRTSFRVLLLPGSRCVILSAVTAGNEVEGSGFSLLQDPSIPLRSTQDDTQGRQGRPCTHFPTRAGPGPLSRRGGMTSFKLLPGGAAEPLFSPRRGSCHLRTSFRVLLLPGSRCVILSAVTAGNEVEGSGCGLLQDPSIPLRSTQDDT